MKKYKVYKDTEFLAEFNEVIPLYAFLKEHMQDPEHFNSMVLAKALVTSGDILFKAKDNHKFIILKIMEDTE